MNLPMPLRFDLMGFRSNGRRRGSVYWSSVQKELLKKGLPGSGTGSATVKYHKTQERIQEPERPTLRYRCCDRSGAAFQSDPDLTTQAQPGKIGSYQVTHNNTEY